MRTKLAIGAAAVAATASLSFAVNGLAGSRLPGGFLDTPAAAAGELLPFADCEELRRWYVEQALPDVGPYGFDSGYWPMTAAGMESLGGAEEGADRASSTGTLDTSKSDVESSATGTNVQEVGVDEPDRAKTDGDLVVHLRRNLLVVTDVSGDEAEELATLRLPRRLASPELLLSGESVLVLGAPEHLWGGPIPIDPIATDLVDRSFIGWPQPLEETTRLLEVSLSDPANPRVESDQTLGGSLLSARQYGDTVRLVLRTGHPTLDFVFPDRDRTRKEAREENRQIVRDSTIEDWVPTARSAGDDPEAAEPLTACSDVRHPRTGAGFGTLTILTLPASDPTSADGTAVTAGGETVYSSTQRLYLATRGPRSTTEVHAFALDGTATSYVASGKLPGTVSDRWSMDEHDGALRVAVAHGRDWSPTDNGITVLREDGDRLEVVGSVRDLGPKEEIKSVRWFDDLAIVVTFRQTDPLYTVDLTDPRRPRPLGELKIPGFSEYLHPIGDERLLGLGQDATLRGVTRGGQASVFDVADLAAPARLDTLALGRHAQPAASYEPRAFTWLADRSVALVGVDNGWNGRASVVELRVSDDGSLREGRRWPLPRWGAMAARTLPLPDDKIALVTEDVTLLP